jgi:hypothetical protein
VTRSVNRPKDFRGLLSLRHVSVAYVPASSGRESSHRKLGRHWGVEVLVAVCILSQSLHRNGCAQSTVGAVYARRKREAWSVKRGDFRRAYTAPIMLYAHKFPWSDSDNVYIASRTLPHQWFPSFQCELPLPDGGGIYATETCRSESGPLRTLCNIY